MSETTEMSDPEQNASTDPKAETGFSPSNGSAAPTWYTAEEMRHYLRVQRYSEEIADELSANYAKNLQQAFNKGYQIGAREAKRQNAQAEAPTEKP